MQEMKQNSMNSQWDSNCLVPGCYRLFTDFRDMYHHFQFFHPGINVIDALPKIIHSKEAVSKITLMIYNSGINQGVPKADCPFCNKKVTKFHIVKRHHSNGDRALLCQKCQKFIPYKVEQGSEFKVLYFKYRQAEKEHQMECDDKKRIKINSSVCHICGKSYTSLRIHLKSVHNLDTKYCAVCDYFVEKNIFEDHQKECLLHLSDEIVAIPQF
jgi:transcription elongation factor Elf1